MSLEPEGMSRASAGEGFLLERPCKEWVSTGRLAAPPWGKGIAERGGQTRLIFYTLLLIKPETALRLALSLSDAFSSLSQNPSFCLTPPFLS